ncbi:MAG: RHS repeat-associated core domain-containing protein [Isosphaeraceae bacterium]|nr:RHS repeat-associated core domain-containing protein [Isosphaeraceae bacterium]
MESKARINDRITSIARTIGGTGTEVDSSFSHDNADRLTTLVHKVSGGATLATYAHGYDSGNRLTSDWQTAGTHTYNATYTYDAADQLTGVSGTNPETYTYDSGGNRTMSGYATGGYNALTSSPGYTYTYDSEGNLTEKSRTSGGTEVTSYAYDFRNRMTGVTIRASSGGAIVHQATYTYDSRDRRIGVELDGTRTWIVYDGVNTYADFDGSGTLATRYLHGPTIDALLARTSSAGDTAWYLTDRLGSVRDLANTSGTVIDHVSYDAFGNILSESNPSAGDRFKYTAREFDPTTGLQSNRARYFHSPTGRWTQPDPIGFAGGDANLYRYVGNDVVNSIDPFGLSDEPKEIQPDEEPTFGKNMPQLEHEYYLRMKDMVKSAMQEAKQQTKNARILASMEKLRQMADSAMISHMSLANITKCASAESEKRTVYFSAANYSQEREDQVDTLVHEIVHLYPVHHLPRQPNGEPNPMDPVFKLTEAMMEYIRETNAYKKWLESFKDKS